MTGLDPSLVRAQEAVTAHNRAVTALTQQCADYADEVDADASMSAEDRMSGPNGESRVGLR